MPKLALTKQKSEYMLAITLFFCGLLLVSPNFSFAQSSPQIISLVPSSLAHNYSGPVTIQITGDSTLFQPGQSVVSITGGSGQQVNYGGGEVNVHNGASLSFQLNSGLPPGTYAVEVATGGEVAPGGTLKVRGTPGVTVSPGILPVGYLPGEIFISGVNTGFSENTGVIVLDQGGQPRDVLGLPSVLSDTALTVALAAGLEAGNYTIKVQTGQEQASTGLAVAQPAAALRHQGTGFQGMPAGYPAAYQLVLKGENTGFGSSTALKLTGDQEGGPDYSAYLGNVNVVDKESISLTLNKGLPVGQYYLMAGMGTQEITVTFTVRAPQLSGMKFISPLAQGLNIPEGYREMRVELYGNDSIFQSSTTVLVNGSSQFVKGITVENNAKISFALAAGLASGSHQVEVDIDGDSTTAGDKATKSFLVTKPVILQVNPGLVVNSGAIPVTLEVTGVNTHFTKGSPQVDIEGVSGEQIITVMVQSDNKLNFVLRPNSIPAAGTYDLVVRTTSNSIGEAARGKGLLKVARGSGISSISPAKLYTDELGSKEVTVTGVGTNFGPGTKVTVGGEELAAQVQSASKLTFIIPAGFATGNYQVKVGEGNSTYSNNILVEIREITLSESKKNQGYQLFDLIITGSGVNFDQGSNKPVVEVSGYGKVVIKDITTSQVGFTFPQGLPVGSYQIALYFPQGVYAGVGTLNARFMVEKPATKLIFKKDGLSVDSIRAVLDEQEIILTAWQLEPGGSMGDVTGQTQWTLVSGSNVVTVDGGRLLLKKAGQAVVRATAGGAQAEIQVVVSQTLPGGQVPAPGEQGLPGGLPGQGTIGSGQEKGDLPEQGLPWPSQYGPGQFPSEGSRPDRPEAGIQPGELLPRTVILTDIQEHWARDNIQRLVAADAIKGYPDGTFKADNKITRAEFAVVLSRLLHLSPENVPKAGFADQDQIPSWARPAVNGVVMAGIVRGYEDNTFRADHQITRAEMAVILARTLQLPGVSGAELIFTDAPHIPQWAKGYVGAAVQRKLIGGYQDGSYRAGSQASRAEAVTMLARLLDNL